jgi:hypothetical protein
VNTFDVPLQLVSSGETAGDAIPPEYSWHRWQCHGVAGPEGLIPLAEREQRLLQEIEHALSAEDPRFVASVRSARPRRGTRTVGVLCVVGVLVGLAVVLAGLASGGGLGTAVGVLGFVLIVGSCLAAVIAVRGRKKPRLRSVPPQPASSRSARSQGLRARNTGRTVDSIRASGASRHRLTLEVAQLIPKLLPGPGCGLPNRMCPSSSECDDDRDRQVEHADDILGVGLRTGCRHAASGSRHRYRRTVAFARVVIRRSVV